MVGDGSLQKGRATSKVTRARLAKHFHPAKMVSQLVPPRDAQEAGVLVICIYVRTSVERMRGVGI